MTGGGIKNQQWSTERGERKSSLVFCPIYFFNVNVDFLNHSWSFLSFSSCSYRAAQGRLDVRAATVWALCGPGGAVEEGLRGTTEQEWKWLVGREVRRGFALTFSLAPQLMLRCCHFHHLKCCHFRCRSLVFAVGSKGGGGGNQGKREEVWEDFHFKQAELCHTVTWLPWQPLFSVSQLPVSSLLLSCVPLFSRLSSSFSRTL